VRPEDFAPAGAAKGRRTPLRHCDSQALRACQSRRCLEDGAISPPLSLWNPAAFARACLGPYALPDVPVFSPDKEIWRKRAAACQTGSVMPDRLGPVRQIDAVWRKKAGADGGAGGPKQALGRAKLFSALRALLLKFFRPRKHRGRGSWII